MPSNQVYFLKQNQDIKEIRSPRCERSWLEFWHRSATIWNCLSPPPKAGHETLSWPIYPAMLPFTLAHLGLAQSQWQEPGSPQLLLSPLESWDSPWFIFSPSPPGYPARSNARSNAKQPGAMPAPLLRAGWQGDSDVLLTSRVPKHPSCPESRAGPGPLTEHIWNCAERRHHTQRCDSRNLMPYTLP